MPLSAQEVRQVLTSARQLQIDAPTLRVEDFFVNVLGLNAVQRVAYFPSPDPNGFLALAVAHLTQERERLLREDSTVPGFAVFKDSLGNFCIAGSDTYLATKNISAECRRRLAQHAVIRTVLRKIQNGHDLEALAAAIMSAQCDYGEATRGSGDQGIDAIGWKQLVLIEPSFVDGNFLKSQALPGEKVFLFASSKAFTDGKETPPKLINPAHIRELVGGWLIQRSSIAKWQAVGIRMLSPVQMILVTTYRLSDDAKLECQSLGVQVWSIPELIYLICVSAPNSVFDPANGHTFSPSEFKKWWQTRNASRLMAA